MEINDLTIIGKLGFGATIKGWIPIRLNPDFIDAFDKLKNLFVIFTDHRVRFVTVKATKLIREKHYLKFEEPEIILEIADQNNLQIAIDDQMIAELTNEEYYDPLNMQVFTNDAYLGLVIDWFNNNAHDVFVVKNEEEQELLIPDVEFYIENIDLDKNRIDVKNIKLLQNI